MNAKTITSALIAAIAGFTLALPGTALADREDRGHRQAQSQHGGQHSRQRTREFKQDRRHARNDVKKDRRYSRRDAYNGHRDRDRRKFNKRENRRHDGYRSYNRDHGKYADKHYKRDRKHYSRHYKRDRKHYYKHDKRHYGHNYGHGGYGTSYYRDDDDDEKLLIGLVVGGILGYALNESTQNNVDDYDAYYDDTAYRGNTSTVNTSSYGSCLQEREYQTTVVVGGREVDAYGTACLQPDGSWKRSPPQVAAY
ncbi:MAG: hypothetical protein KJO10_03410 [Gammaproteobacteria bacterium]|nr:hypothetical protein [Gammaproteobacteria bacterium]